MNTQRNSTILDLLILSIALGANLMALFYQYYFNEIPCPLCLLQRVGLFFIAFGAAMNLKFGKNFKYDFIIIISSLYGLAVATRQVLLHIMPGDPGYGSEFLGLHFYTWNDIISLGFIIMILMYPLFKKITLDECVSKISLSKKIIVDCSFALLMSLLVVNTVLVYFECGFEQCPSDPTEYKNFRWAYGNNSWISLHAAVAKPYLSRSMMYSNFLYETCTSWKLIILTVTIPHILHRN